MKGGGGSCPQLHPPKSATGTQAMKSVVELGFQNGFPGGMRQGILFGYFLCYRVQCVERFVTPPPLVTVCFDQTSIICFTKFALVGQKYFTDTHSDVPFI